MRLFKSIVVANAVAALIATSAFAQSVYPDKPISVVFPNRAGGAYHTIALTVLDLIKDDVSQPIGVQAMPGAGTSTGTRFVMGQPADGYTLLYIHDAILQTAKFGMLGLEEKTYEAFAAKIEPLAQTNQGLNALYVRTDSPFNDAKDLADYAKANPGELRAAINAGAAAHLIMAGLSVALDAELNLVHVGGGGNGFRQAILSGDVDLVSLDPGGAVNAMVKAGHLKPLVYYGEERHEVIPDTPTMAELGFETPLVMKLQGYFWIHPDTPEEIKQYWRDRLGPALRDEANIAAIRAKLGIDVVYLEGEELRSAIEDRFNARAEFIDRFNIVVK